eukprot:m.6728 g.6728  ORF g.6728 m.6728 type:complete len:215 (-) comp2644_c0_seq1:126-770(-)
MVNPRQRRKQRAGHVKRQTTKQAREVKRRQREGKKIVIKIPEIAKVWDRQKSAKANMAAIGLMSDPNVDLYGDKNRVTQTKIDASLVTYEVVEALEREAAKHTDYKAYASRGEILFIQKCLKQYGSDYKTMSLDLKLNTHQHTPAQLKKKVEKYIFTLQLMSTTKQQKEVEEAMKKNAEDASADEGDEEEIGDIDGFLEEEDEEDDDEEEDDEE